MRFVRPGDTSTRGLSLLSLLLCWLLCRCSEDAV